MNAGLRIRSPGVSRGSCGTLAVGHFQPAWKFDHLTVGVAAVRLSTFAIILGSIAAGTIAALTARSIILSQSVVSEGAKTTIVIASQTLPFGTVLTKENLREVEWSAPVVPEGAFGSVVDMLKDGERVTLASIARSQPVLAAHITRPGQKASLSALIGPGMRAVTIRVDDVRGVAGFIMPGDRVDVVLTRTEEKHSFTDLLLQNVKVLAIDQIANERQDKAQVAKAVTVEVSAEQGQKLVLAGGAGVLSLILREVGAAHSPEPTRRVTTLDLEPDSDAARKAPDEERRPPPTTTVRIIRGAVPETASVPRQSW